MTSHHHCHHHAAQSTGRQPFSRNKAFAGWLIPTAILALIPKCPLCIALWLAAAGFSLSLTTIANLRTALMILCLTALTTLITLRLRRLFA
jgi:hypothetical protein